MSAFKRKMFSFYEVLINFIVQKQIQFVSFGFTPFFVIRKSLDIHELYKLN